MNISDDFLDQQRLVADPLADRLVAQLFAENMFHSFNEKLQASSLNHSFEVATFPDFQKLPFCLLGQTSNCWRKEANFSTSNQKILS
jgi:hypothetical protein